MDRAQSVTYSLGSVAYQNALHTGCCATGDREVEQSKAFLDREWSLILAKNRRVGQRIARDSGDNRDAGSLVRVHIFRPLSYFSPKLEATRSLTGFFQ